MSTNIAGGICIGELGACVVRAAKLDSDCTPTGGTNGGIVTAGLVTLTADPDIQEGTVFEPTTACGVTAYSVAREDRVRRYNLSGEFIFFDDEMANLLFDSTLILGKSGGSFAGKVIGNADKLYSASAGNGAYLEVITQAVQEGSGDCITSGGGAPVAFGYIFGKTKLVPGSTTWEDAERRMTFTGKASNNPNLFNGPWNDYPGAGYIPNSPRVRVGYSQAEYDAILDVVQCGFVNLPAGS